MKKIIQLTAIVALVGTTSLMVANPKIGAIQNNSGYDVYIDVVKAGKNAVTADKTGIVKADGSVVVPNGTSTSFKTFPITNMDNAMPVRLMQGSKKIIDGLYLWQINDKDVYIGLMPVRSQSVKVTVNADNSITLSGM